MVDQRSDALQQISGPHPAWQAETGAQVVENTSQLGEPVHHQGGLVQ
nr:hypothetical protein [Streptomyces typhae]